MGLGSLQIVGYYFTAGDSATPSESACLFGCEPVVSLRSTTGYDLSTLRVDGGKRLRLRRMNRSATAAEHPQRTAVMESIVNTQTVCEGGKLKISRGFGS